MARRLTVLLLVLPALAGCGGGDGGDESFRVEGSTLTIYSSLPRGGDSAEVARAVAAGQRLALDEAGRRVGNYRIKLVELDAAEPDDRSWDPELVEANAERAAKDDTTIAYLGELEYGGSAVSIPVTNDEGILQVSALDGLTTLTQSQGTGPQTGPERYYPSEQRTFLRLVPTDRLQARALVAWAKARGATKISLAHDDRLFGRELAEEVVAATTAQRVQLATVEEIRPDEEGYADVVEKLAEEDPNAVIYTGMTGDAAAPLLEAVTDAFPAAVRLGSSGIASTALPGADILLLKPAFPASEYPRSGRAVLRKLERRTGGPVAPEALYGYEAMRVVLDAVAAAGPDGNERAAVVEAALRPRTRESVLGEYAIDAQGDVNTTRFAGYRRIGAALQFLEEREPGAGPDPEPEDE